MSYRWSSSASKQVLVKAKLACNPPLLALSSDSLKHDAEYMS